MIRGVVTAQREAIVQLRVTGTEGDEEEIEAVIDTGFTDFLSLSPSLVTLLKLPLEAPLLGTLADGRVVEMNSYRATVLWDDHLREVLVIECEGGALVGMSLLYGYNLHIEAVDDGAVSILKRE